MKTRALVFLTLTMSLFIVGLFPAAAQEDACYSKDGNWLPDTQKCTVSVGVHVNVDYPLYMTQYPEAAKIIDAFLGDQERSFITSYTPDFTLPAHTNDWTMSITNEHYQYSDDIQSVLFTVEQYTGGAHPGHFYTTFNFDLKSGKEIQLEDVFKNGDIPRDTIAQIVEADLTKKLGDLSDVATIEQGTGTDPKNYVHWILTPTSIIFLFDEYQVAPYAAGPQKVEIPFTALKGIVAAPFSG